MDLPYRSRIIRPIFILFNDIIFDRTGYRVFRLPDIRFNPWERSLYSQFPTTLLYSFLVLGDPIQYEQKQNNNVQFSLVFILFLLFFMFYSYPFASSFMLNNYGKLTLFESYSGGYITMQMYKVILLTTQHNIFFRNKSQASTTRALHTKQSKTECLRLGYNFGSTAHPSGGRNQ